MKKTKIFISYVDEDEQKAKNIYNFLEKKGCIPWLNKDILPGQDWKIEIEKAIEKCDFFIACLSKNSVSKEGYFQKELKIALNFLDTKPDDLIFIIPVLLDNCSVPFRFQKLQRCNFSDKNWQNKLLKAIEINNA